MATMHTYNGYKITVTVEGVRVFDPRWPREPALYKTDSLETAMTWVDAYRKGENWASVDLENQRRA